MLNTSNEEDPTAVTNTGQDLTDTRPTEADLMPTHRAVLLKRSPTLLDFEQRSSRPIPRTPN